MKRAFINARIILEEGYIWNGYVKTDGKLISEVGDMADVGDLDSYEVTDVQGKYIAPGLIDIHNHGCEFYNFSEDPLYCAERTIKNGVTTVLPSFYTTLTLDEMLEGAEKIRQARKSGVGKIMHGLYMEGPYMECNLGSYSYMMKWSDEINPAEYVPLFEGTSDLAKVWAIDPARDGISDFMAYVRGKAPDAIFSLGHSTATFEQCQKVRKWGVKLQTHHGDSGKAPGKAQGTIGAGCDEYTLYNPDMFAELICDEIGIHVTPGMLKTVVKTKGIERIILISDSNCSKKDNKNNEEMNIAYGPDLNYDDEGFLAGSHLSLNNACRNFMKHTGYGLAHAIRMASYNPAVLLGIDDKVGSIAPGKIANLIVIDDIVQIDTVILEGEDAVKNGEICLAAM